MASRYHSRQKGNLEKLCLSKSVECVCIHEAKYANEIHACLLRQQWVFELALLSKQKV